MREVPAKLFGFIRENSRGFGADIEAAQAGLKLRHVDVDARGERVDWDELAIFFERAHGHLSEEEVERMGEGYVEAHLWQKLVARVLGTERLLCRIGWELAKPSFPHTEIVVEPHGDRTRLEQWLPDRYEPSPVYFRANVGQLRVLSTLVGCPPSRVEADVGPRHGVYDVFHAEPPRPLDRAVEAGRDAIDLVAREVIDLMYREVSADARAADARAESRVLELQREHGLTHKEARVVARLASGMKPKEIARALRVRISTVRSHLASAYSKTGTRGQAELVRLVLTHER